MSAHLALFGQAIALHKSSRVECSMRFIFCMFLCKPRGFLIHLQKMVWICQNCYSLFTFPYLFLFC